jgi:aldose 1-epimerase
VAIREHEFGELGDGRRVARFALTSPSGLGAEIVSYGGTLTSLAVPDRAGRLGDVVLGFEDLAGYAGGRGYLGALIGRCANRISGARFALDGAVHRLTANEGDNHLHGGFAGFDKVVWSATPRSTPAGPALELGYLSVDGEEGYPGNLSVRVTYTLELDALRIDYVAASDRDTVVNLTHHAYWNLAGHAAGSILDHRLVIDADRFAVVGPGQIPTGELRAVAGTPFDFRRGAPIGARIDGDDEQLRAGGGYDHSFAITGADERSEEAGGGDGFAGGAGGKAPRGIDGQLRRAARVSEPVTGRVMEVFTTEPAIQLYSGNYLDGMRGKAGATYHRRTGFCLETQHHPDSPNHPAFATATLRAGVPYHTATVYRFLVE